MNKDSIISLALDDCKFLVPDKEKGFTIGIFDSILNDKTVQLKLKENNEIKQFQISQIYIPNFECINDFDDICTMDSVNLATLFCNIRDRFFKNKIYTYISNILIAINPYKQVPDLYTEEIKMKYHSKSFSSLPAHIYSIVNKALNDIKISNKNQTIIISGESGSGKTEKQKEILKYICYISNNNTIAIQKKILFSNLILESFGNAMTIRNKNSSRFGKYTIINFDNQYKIIGGKVLYYLLERSRIIYQSKYERNYHIFYQLISGINDKWREEFNIQKIEQFDYLSKGYQYFLSYENNCIIDDVYDYNKLINALKEIGYNNDNIKEIFKILSGILHLGNIKFNQTTNDGEYEIENEEPLKQVSILFGFDKNLLKNALKYRKIYVTGSTFEKDSISIQLKNTEIINARDALAKKIYIKLFDSIVLSINDTIMITSNEYHSLSVLDIAGFEFYKKNCFEQFCINYSNEKLQNFFNKIIFINEQKLYEEENIDVEEVFFKDNSECLQLLDSKYYGIFTLLNEESYLPQPLPTHFTESVYKKNSTNKCLTTGRKYNMKEYKNIKDNDGFLIHHYANDVFYDTKNFIEKNNDNLHSSLEDFLQKSTNIYFRKLFFPTNTKKCSKLNSPTISSTFKHQLEELLKELEYSGIHFIKCIKPNDFDKSNIFDADKVSKQLEYLGINNVLLLQNSGYPYKIDIDELYQRYIVNFNYWIKNLERKSFLTSLLNAIKVDKQNYKFGKTKLFFKNNSYDIYNKLLRKDDVLLFTKKVKYYLNKLKWKKIILSIIFTTNLSKVTSLKHKAAIIIQANVKGFLLRKKVKKIQKIYSDICNFSKILDKEIEFIRSFNSTKKSDLWKQANHIFVLIINTKECCKELNYKKIRFLLRDRSEISSKILNLSITIKNLKLEQESIDEKFNLKNIENQVPKIFEERQKLAKKYKQMKDVVKKLKNQKEDYIHNINDNELLDIIEVEEKLNEKVEVVLEKIPKLNEIQLFNDKELKKMSFQNLKINLGTLVNKEKKEQCKEEMERRYDQLKKWKKIQK
uniref:Myosin motor domain-containing protein n=1 Tax=Strongyloides stercoralis TaxID=6248 RepID=A0A0K0ECP3_STRER